jgi:hypothetical protein
MRRFKQAFWPYLSASRALAVVLALIGWVPRADAQSQTWTNAQCGGGTGGTECPRIGSPQGICKCGLWGDTPGSSMEAAYAFVESISPTILESATWVAILSGSDVVTVGTDSGQFNQLRVRAAVSDGSKLVVVAYASESPPDGFAGCRDFGANAAFATMVVSWSGASANGVFSLKVGSAVAAGASLRAICISIKDDPPGVVPSSQRSSALIDYVRLRNTATGATRILETFQE